MDTASITVIVLCSRAWANVVPARSIFRPVHTLASKSHAGAKTVRIAASNAMSSPQVLVTRNTIAPSALTLLRAHCDVDFHDHREAMPRAELIARVRGKQGLVTMITDVIDRDVLEAADALRVVANVAVGFNNIDLSAARQRNVVVTNTPDVLTDA